MWVFYAEATGTICSRCGVAKKIKSKKTTVNVANDAIAIQSLLSAKEGIELLTALNMTGVADAVAEYGLDGVIQKYGFCTCSNPKFAKKKTKNAGEQKLDIKFSKYAIHSKIFKVKADVGICKKCKKFCVMAISW